MIVYKKYYKFYRDLTGYHIQGGQIGTTIWYELVSVGNNSETVLLSATIADMDLITLDFPAEDVYRVDIYYPDDSNPGLEITDSFDVRYFPTLKQKIIEQLKYTICNCENLDSELCVSNTQVPIQKNLYNTQLTANSIFTYNDLLLSPQFLREAECCVKNFISNYSEQILSELELAYTALATRGNPVSTIHTLRRYTALYYIMFYVIELDMSLYQYSYLAALPTDTDEYAAIEDTFDTSAIRACFTQLGLDFDKMVKVFSNCYEINDYSDCRVVVIDTNALVKNLVLEVDYGGGLEYIGSDIFLDVATSFDLSKMLWEVTGTPIQLKVNEPTYSTIVNQPAAGVQEIIFPVITYPPAIPAVITWQLKGANVDTIERQIRWGYPVFYGTFTPAAPGDSPTEADILDASNYRIAQNTYENTAIVFPQDTNTGVGVDWFFALPSSNAGGYQLMKYSNSSTWGSISYPVGCGPLPTALSGYPASVMARLCDTVDVDLGGGAGIVEYTCFRIVVTDLPADVQMV